jgi:hypothetical protein
MKKISLLNFPETLLDRKLLIPSLLLFNSVSCFRLLKEEPGVFETGFLDEKLLFLHYPVDLEDEDVNFRKFLQDLSQNCELYSANSLAGLSTDKFFGESVSELLANITADPAVENKGKYNELVDSEKAAVLQAMLFLKLMENYKKDQLSLKKEFDKLKENEGEVYSMLQGEIPDLFSQEAFLDTKGTSQRLRQQIKAWSVLFMAGLSDTFSAISTVDSDVAEVLFEAYENLYNSFPVNFLSLPLADFKDEYLQLGESGELSKENIGEIIAFKKANQDLISEICSYIEATAEQEDIPGENSTGPNNWLSGKRNKECPDSILLAIDELKNIIDTSEIFQLKGSLEFFQFPGMSLPEIFAELARKKCSERQKTRYPKNAILVLQQPGS